MAIEWQDSYQLGDAEMDAQHQLLFGLVNTLLAATEKSSLAEALANLFSHTRAHFTHEENSMRLLAYPGMNAHVEQHNTLMSKLTNVAELLDDYSLDMANLESFLSAWLYNHIETLDKQLVSFIRKQ